MYQLCLGCYDSSKFSGGITWVPVVSQTYWSVSMTGISAKPNRQNALSNSIIGVSSGFDPSLHWYTLQSPSMAHSYSVPILRLSDLLDGSALTLNAH